MLWFLLTDPGRGGGGSICEEPCIAGEPGNDGDAFGNGAVIALTFEGGTFGVRRSATGGASFHPPFSRFFGGGGGAAVGGVLEIGGGGAGTGTLCMGAYAFIATFCIGAVDVYCCCIDGVGPYCCCWAEIDVAAGAYGFEVVAATGTAEYGL